MPSMMPKRVETKPTGSQYRKAMTESHSEVMKRVADRRTKVKVSETMSPESRLAIMMVQKETAQERQQPRSKIPHKTEETKTALIIPVTTPAKKNVKPPNSAGDDSRSSYTTTTTDTATTTTTSDNTTPGFAEALERICTLRLPGDITDKSYTPRNAKRRALRHGEHLHNAMEVVEIVKHVDSQDEEENDEDESDEEEALHRAATISSLERCTAWVELHFSSDDVNSESGADR